MTSKTIHFPALAPREHASVLKVVTARNHILYGGGEGTIIPERHTPAFYALANARVHEVDGLVWDLYAKLFLAFPESEALGELKEHGPTQPAYLLGAVLDIPPQAMCVLNALARGQSASVTAQKTKVDSSVPPASRAYKDALLRALKLTREVSGRCEYGDRDPFDMMTAAIAHGAKRERATLKGKVVIVGGFDESA